MVKKQVKEACFNAHPVTCPIKPTNKAKSLRILGVWEGI
jgi:hypothetical protein